MPTVAKIESPAPKNNSIQGKALWKIFVLSTRLEIKKHLSTYFIAFQLTVETLNLSIFVLTYNTNQDRKHFSRQNHQKFVFVVFRSFRRKNSMKNGEM